MPTMSIHPASALDSELTEYFEPIVARWQKAALDVILGASAEPAAWASHSPEHTIVAQAYGSLPAARRAPVRRSTSRVLQTPIATARMNRLLSDPVAHGIVGSLTSRPATSVAARDGRVPAAQTPGISTLSGTFRLGPPPANIASLAGQLLERDHVPSLPGALLPFNALELLLVRVRCVDETDGLFGSEAGSDEIEMGGFAIGPPITQANASVPAPIWSRSLGRYDDGTVKTFNPPRRLAAIPIGKGNEYPQRFMVSLFMVESDGGNFGSFVRDVVNQVRKVLDSNWVEIAAFLAAGLAGAIYAKIYTWITSKILGLFAQLWDDTYFSAAGIRDLDRLC